MTTPEERAWEVVRLAFEERVPSARTRPWGRLALAAAAVAAAVVAGAAVSPSGRAVFQRVREAVGVEDAAPALVSLPAPGRLLVVSRTGGVWVVDADGLRRRLGAYRDATWSPHGEYVVATRANELVALTPTGDVRWVLARPHPRLPRWEGTRTDTRIAYFSARALRVVAGDGTGDHLLDPDAAAVPVAWDPARLHTLAYAARGAVALRRADGGVLWRRPLRVRPASLVWSSDGRLLAVAARSRVVVLDARGRVRETVSMLGARFGAAAFRPSTHELAFVLRRGGRSEVRAVDVDRRGRGRLLFAGPGAFRDIAWSPARGWLLVDWADADQWVFIHGSRVRAVANVRRDFGSAPTVAGRWCCG